jgi:hypothetical protein
MMRKELDDFNENEMKKKGANQQQIETDSTLITRVKQILLYHRNLILQKRQHGREKFSLLGDARRKLETLIQATMKTEELETTSFLDDSFQ